MEHRLHGLDTDFEVFLSVFETKRARCTGHLARFVFARRHIAFYLPCFVFRLGRCVIGKASIIIAEATFTVLLLKSMYPLCHPERSKGTTQLSLPQSPFMEHLLVARLL